MIGGGLAGACAAALLARHAGIEAARVALLTAQLPAPAIAGAPAELRVAAISRASEHVLRAAGAWQRLDMQRICAYERMRVWHESAAADGAGALCFDAADLGEPNLGYIAEMVALQRACIESFREAGGVLREAAVDALEFDAGFRAAALGRRPVRGAAGGRRRRRRIAGARERGTVGANARLSAARHRRDRAQRPAARSHGMAALPAHRAAGAAAAVRWLQFHRLVAG